MADPSSLSAGYILQHTVVALFGGVAHAINKHRNGQSKTMVDFILLAVLSSFFGVLAGFIAIHFFPTSEYLTLSIAGTGGWLGVEMTPILVDFIKKLFNVNQKV